ncbi:Ribosomal proteins 50S-L15, 50S-L18e, 60S-L27A, putative [Leishmania shawi]|uniref:Ribosomal protein 50S-L15, 50S-L18e, 60S-L27A n=1 Tax=Leishmania shawi TaxID=5680 RepID=A0ABR3DXA5_9TRYP
MPTRFKKCRHQRGSTFCGYGRVGKHRKHESGRGNAGGMHHHRINLKNVTWKPTINLNNLTRLIAAEEAAKAKKGGVLPVVDLQSSGYAKLLGNGHIQVPCIVKARYVSKLADKKIRKAGGAVVLQA